MIGRRPFLAAAATIGVGGACSGTAAPPVATTGGGSSGSLLDFLPDAERAAIRDGTSQFDCGPALTAAWRATGRLHVPAGRYVVATPVAFEPRVKDRFAPGLTMTGDGAGRTVFDDRTGGAALFDFDSGADRDTGFRAIRGIHLEGFTIEGERSGPRTAAIRLRGCYESSIRRVNVTWRPGHGIVIPCRLGDIDGSNMIALEELRIENCAGWGIDAKADAGYNELSFLSLRHVFVQNCGTAAKTDPPVSGGMRYKGQMLSVEQSAFAVNQNVGLYIPGEAGLAVNVQLSSTAFENNAGRHLLCSGVSILRGTNLQFFSNEQYRVTAACDFPAVTQTVQNVSLDGILVRATPGNAPYVAFRFHGSNLMPGTYDVRNVVWSDFGHPGQVRFEGDVPSLRPRPGGAG